MRGFCCKFWGLGRRVEQTLIQTKPGAKPTVQGRRAALQFRENGLG